MGVLRPQVSGELVIITKLAYDTVGSNETGVKSINEHMFTRPVFLILSSLHLPISPPHLPDPDPSHCVPNWENWEVCVCVEGRGLWWELRSGGGVGKCRGKAILGQEASKTS